MSIDQLVPEVRRVYRDRKGLPIYINGDKSSDLGVVVRVLDRLRSAGFVEMSLGCRD